MGQLLILIAILIPSSISLSPPTTRIINSSHLNVECHDCFSSDAVENLVRSTVYEEPLFVDIGHSESLEVEARVRTCKKQKKELSFQIDMGGKVEKVMFTYQRQELSQVVMEHLCLEEDNLITIEIENLKK